MCCVTFACILLLLTFLRFIIVGSDQSDPFSLEHQVYCVYTIFSNAKNYYASVFPVFFYYFLSICNYNVQFFTFAPLVVVVLVVICLVLVVIVRVLSS